MRKIKFNKYDYWFWGIETFWLVLCLIFLLIPSLRPKVAESTAGALVILVLVAITAVPPLVLATKKETK